MRSAGGCRRLFLLSLPLLASYSRYRGFENRPGGILRNDAEEQKHTQRAPTQHTSKRVRLLAQSFAMVLQSKKTFELDPEVMYTYIHHARTEGWGTFELLLQAETDA